MKYDLKAMKVMLLLERVADEFGVTSEEILGLNRGIEVDRARNLMIHLIAEIYPEWSDRKIAGFMGRKNHATVFYAKRRYQQLMAWNSEFLRIADKFKQPIES